METSWWLRQTCHLDTQHKRCVLDLINLSYIFNHAMNVPKEKYC